MSDYVKNLEQAIRQYIGEPILKRIQESPVEALSITHRQISATMLFIDIRSFTDVKEKIEADILINVLNIYLEKMCKIITLNNGYIDSINGDAIFAFWGINGGNHVDEACKCALECLNELKAINKVNISKVNFDIGIGINTGSVLLGNFGSIYKTNFTVNGSEVNLTSRLSSLSKRYNVNILTSQMTVDSLNRKFNIQKIDELNIKGKPNTLRIYSLTP